MSYQKLYSINSEINNMFGGEMIGGDCAVWIVLLIVIFVIVGIILYLTGIFVFTTPKIFKNSKSSVVSEEPNYSKKVKDVKTVSSEGSIDSKATTEEGTTTSKAKTKTTEST
jgi:cytoskeletal protein RodZ